MTQDQFLNQYLFYPHQQQEKPSHLRAASVLIPVVNRDGQLSILLNTRAFHLRHHPGQISFPGGKQEDSDRNVIDCALRECEEELGISPSLVEVCGTLPAMDTVTDFWVTPVIGFLDQNYQLNVDQNEVHDAFEVPLTFLLNRNNHLSYRIKRQDQQLNVLFIPWQDRLIWGATAKILQTLSKALDTNSPYA